jgi:DnaJ family protein C protein 1
MGEVKKRLEKKQKKKKASSTLDEIDTALQECYDNLKSPTLKMTIPYRLVVFVYTSVISIPSLLKCIMKARNENAKKLENEVLNDENDQIEQINEEKPGLTNRKSNKNNKKENLIDLNPKQIEKSQIQAPVIYLPNRSKEKAKEPSKENDLSVNKSNEWSDKDKNELIKAIVKFPAGTPDRWAKIGEYLNRPVNECINMEKLIKSNLTSSNLSKLNASTWTSSNSTSQISIKEEPTQSEKLNSNLVGIDDKWSQEQQKLFEKALKEIGKDVPNRWDKIAEIVPGKNKVH